MLLEDLSNIKTVYGYSLRTTEDGVEALRLIISKKEELLNSKIIGVDKICTLAEEILTSYENNENSQSIKILNNYLLKLLYLEGVKDFLANPADAEFRNFVAIQLHYIKLAITGDEELISYTSEEMIKIINGTADFYSDGNFIVTAKRSLINPNKEVIDLFCDWLPQETVSVDGDVAGELEWIEMVLLSVILHAAWSNFSILNEKNRKILLNNFIYLGVLAGIDFNFICDYLSKDSTVKGDNLITEIFNSKEKILVGDIQTKEFREIAKMYFNIYNDSYEREGYLNQIYENDTTPRKKNFINNLRVSLNPWLRFINNK